MPTITHGESPLPRSQTIRVASMNVSLYGDVAGQTAARLAGGADGQAIKLSRIIRTIRPDILLLCEIDHEPDAVTVNRFADGYLNATRADSTQPIDYPYRWSIPTNTGQIAGLDLDNDGKTILPNDAWGFGLYPGQYAMAVLSRFPIDRNATRTFQNFLWSDLPGALRPIDPESGEVYYSDVVWKRLRLSSKNHADVPIEIPQSGGGTRTLHLLVSHPTPPVFDGPEDRNGRRNHDEIRFWREYVCSPEADFLIDDAGVSGGLKRDEWFVIAGDLNSDPVHGDSRQEGIRDLLRCPRVRDVAPESAAHGVATALFGTRRVRVDYVLPSVDIEVTESGVVWPEPDSPLGRCLDATDHRMVWIDFQIPSE
ncbi:endonuclease/exonuclease/phosphatase family protein [Aporhodopirellula aestuarii]|uniref:Endonuclease/exonuclease/phosphatase family protein n=1 Tax=Aporhodopirellula aestuarii TaxID=2950107 RepID=A0ABT0UD57_9BACT|nr:endonuclease/exonuclease/phosphatase family protein [Aporhodopirellula aestuarii]MCM2374967.1 endonuclease/exonuclease/phosphatase family protein [Aporhodopirellula aestuarii]